jgi:hypothetical protein
MAARPVTSISSAQGKRPLLDQIHHGHNDLPAPGQIPGQLMLVHLSLLAYRVVTLLQAALPSRLGNPILSESG